MNLTTISALPVFRLASVQPVAVQSAFAAKANRLAPLSSDVFFASTVRFGRVNKPIDYAAMADNVDTNISWQYTGINQHNLLKDGSAIGSVKFDNGQRANEVKVTPIKTKGGIALKLQPKGQEFSITVAPGGKANAFGVTVILNPEGELPAVPTLNEALENQKALTGKAGIDRPDVEGINPAEHKVIILAAGTGSRLREVTGDLPKNLFPLANGKTVIENLVDGLKRDGFDTKNLVLVVQKRHLAGFKKALEKYPDINFFTQPEANGTAGAIDDVVQSKQYKHWFAENPEADKKPVLVLGADHIHNIDFRPLLANQIKQGADIALGGYPSEKEAIKGNLGVWIMEGEANQSGFIERLIEKPKAYKEFGDSRAGNIFLQSMTPPILRSLRDIKNNSGIMEEIPMKNSKGKPEFDFSKHVLAVAYRNNAKVWGEVYKPEDGYFWSDIGTRKALYEDTLKYLLSGKVYPPEETEAAHKHVDANGVFYQNPEWRKHLEGSLEGPVWVLKNPN